MTLKKKNVLVGALASVALMVLFLYSWKVGLCSANDYTCSDSYSYFAQELLIFVPVLIFSLITYRLRDEIFQAWVKYAIWWVPLTIVLTLVAPDQRSQAIPSPSMRGFFILGSTLSFFVISLVIIVWKWAMFRKR